MVGGAPQDKPGPSLCLASVVGVLDSYWELLQSNGTFLLPLFSRAGSNPNQEGFNIPQPFWWVAGLAKGTSE